MKEILDDKKPTAKEMNLPEEFVYATRIVNSLGKIDFTKSCDIEEAVRMVTKTFVEYKGKVEDGLIKKEYVKDILIKMIDEKSQDQKKYSSTAIMNTIAISTLKDIIDILK